jgi:predicted metal-dependent hydrolase
VIVERLFARQMKTKWRSYNPRSASIRLNTELAKKTRECFEYLLVHELIHLLEPSHNARFIAIMTDFFCRGGASTEIA